MNEPVFFYLFIFIIFASVGLGLEVVFTAITGANKSKDKHLFGFSSLWYAPIYGLLVPLGISLLSPLLADFPALLRGLLYTPLYHAGEFITMGILRIMLGSSPSEKSYYTSRFHIWGLTRLDYAPAMFIMSLIFESLYIFLLTP